MRQTPQKSFFFCIFGLLSYGYNIYQVRMEFRKLFDILVHPTANVQSLQEGGVGPETWKQNGRRCRDSQEGL